MKPDNQGRVLLIEPDEPFATALAHGLLAHGLRVDRVVTGAAGFVRARSSSPALVIINVQLADISGLDLVRLVATKTAVCARTSSEQEGQQALEFGARAFVLNATTAGEVVLKAVALRAGEIIVDADRREVFLEGRQVLLGPLEFKLLQVLVERVGRPQSRSTLLADVWGVRGRVATRTVDAHIKFLRTKLGALGDRIETLRGLGYRLRPID